MTIDASDYLDEPSNPLIQQAVNELMTRNWKRINDPRIKAVTTTDWPAYAQDLPPRRVLIVLEGERPISTNDYYTGKHWSVRSAETSRVKLLMREQIDPDTARIFDGRVDITMTAYFKGNTQDSGNVSAKPYIDALIGWYIKDDGIKYVRRVATESRKDNKRPRVEIEVVAV